ncbi:unnamed protein product [Sphagnum jensenii]|uniref:Uncharacterized protein n=1 Tax=Sphagnum jensenii TaxID=128206 RepID=A0ABP0WTL7_9BRYO
MEGERVFFEGGRTAVTDGTPALAMWTMQQHDATNWPRKSFLSEKKTCSNISDTIRKGARPDMLVIASGCTLLVGEDKLSSLHATENDLLKKMLPLCTQFYGKVQFILGYIAAGTVFQWVYIGKDGKQLKQVAPPLDLSVVSDCCSLCKHINNFEKYCKAQGTDFAAIKKAYKLKDVSSFRR